MLVLWEPGFVQNNVIFQHYIGGKLDFLHLIAHLQVTLNPISRHRFGHRLKFHELSPTINMEFLKPYLQINITPQNIFLEVISLNVNEKERHKRRADIAGIQQNIRTFFRKSEYIYNNTINNFCFKNDLGITTFTAYS